jgi:hypothetical protein
MTLNYSFRNIVNFLSSLMIIWSISFLFPILYNFITIPEEEKHVLLFILITDVTIGLIGLFVNDLNKQ